MREFDIGFVLAVGVLCGGLLGWFGGYARAYADIWLATHGVKSFQEWRRREVRNRWSTTGEKY